MKKCIGATLLLAGVLTILPTRSEGRTALGVLVAVPGVLTDGVAILPGVSRWTPGVVPLVAVPARVRSEGRGVT